jgi:starch synthase (maltosyl-transferring)
MLPSDGRQRAVISHVTPQVEEGRFAIKRIVGDVVTISAYIFADGHNSVAANLLFRSRKQKNWKEVPMTMGVNDQWSGTFTVDTLGLYFYTIHAWVDYFGSWQQDITKKFQAGMKIKTEIELGIKFLEETLQHRKHPEIKRFLIEIKKAKSEEQRLKLATNEKLSFLMREFYPNKQWLTEMPKALSIIVDSRKARFSTWYELFPRSCSPKRNKHGTFKDCQQLLPEIANMGFDVLYFPPIHPIGYSKRKGKSNQLNPNSKDPGSPWAIGSNEGGHKAIHPQLGSLEDFTQLISNAKQLGIDIALDIAIQCSLDHPYIHEHPDWFNWRPDGTIQYAENPPKKYEDIVPFYFESKNWKELWLELRSIFLFWIEKGVKIFRVDNPHTKPFAFWEWIITTIKQEYPDVIFLSEAFTRPQVMYWLSKLGFTQSYTYFTWRHTKQELTDYFTAIILSEINEYFRPNLWTNTPDILTEELQKGGRSVFISRLILAATLSSNYGMYGPAFELMEWEGKKGTEEYLHSEKYEIRHWNRETNDSLKPLIMQLNQMRRKYEALQQTSNLKFLEIDNDQILYYGKFHSTPAHAVLILVNLDPFQAQSGRLKMPLDELGLSAKGSYRVHELLSKRYYIWEGEYQTITLEPQMPACIFLVQKKVRREVDFEYFL